MTTEYDRLVPGLRVRVISPDLAADFSGAKIPPGVGAPVEVIGEVHWDKFPEAVFVGHLRFDTTVGRYDLVQFEVSDASGITTADLHRYSVPRMVSAIASAALVVDLDDTTYVQLGSGVASFEAVMAQLDLEAIRERVASDGPSASTLFLVSLLYTYAWIVGQPPNEMVTTTLDVPKRTATRWIARARSEGALVVGG